MVTEKSKQRLRLYGIVIILVSILAFFFGSGRGILAQYSYLVWGAPLLAIGAIVIIISYLLPSKEIIRKKEPEEHLRNQEASTTG
jgi:hypothetical protein